MKNLILCSTCGYPLTPEERIGLVEENGVMVKPWVSLTDEDKQTLSGGFFTGDFGLFCRLVSDIEANLKEKNHG